MTPSAVLVLGGSRGIGQALAEYFWNRKVAVLACSRNPSACQWESAKVDVRDLADLEAPARWLADFPPGRMVILTAASFGPVGPIARIDMDRWADAVVTNVVGAANALHVLVPMLQSRDRIVIFAGGGIGGPKMQPRATSYTTSKMAIAALIEGVARDPTTAVPIFGLAPGAFPTDFNKEALEVDPSLSGNELLLQIKNIQNQEIDISRLVRALNFLISSDSEPLSGRVLAVERDDLQRSLEFARNSPDAFRMRRVDGDLIVSQHRKQ